MRIAYLDCFSGISGDMFLGAAVDAGVSLDKLQAVARSLNVGAELRCKRVERGGIASTKVDVVVRGRVERPLDEEQEHTHSDHDHGHSHSLEHHEHEHSHGDHAHGHSHEHEHTHSHEHEHHVHRGLKEIRQIIGSAEIGTKAEKLALKAFELLAEAEGKIHNRHPESIHFHEVGSEDAIVDIVCSAVAAVELGVEEWYCSALNVGGGTVKCAHGVLPVPAPATAELLRGMPVYSSGVKKELLTPTGAALLGALDVRFEPLPAMSVSAAGYGAGGMDLPGTSNVVRLMVGESALRGGAALEGSDTVAVLEANIDDMNPQLFGYVQQKLLDAGALDAFGVPVQMKKGRPGIVMTALAKPADAELLSRILLTETTTLGVRMRREQRRVLDREHVKVESKWGAIRVKLGILQGEVVNCAPEFEDCRAIAEANGVPLKMVMQEAVRLYLSEAGEDESVGHAASGKASKSILS